MAGAKTSTQYWNRLAGSTLGELVVIDNVGLVYSIGAGGPGDMGVPIFTQTVLRLPGVSGNYVSTPDTSAISLVGGGTETKTLRVPGTSGNYASTPDSAALSITGDIDIRAKVALDDWTPATENAVVTKRNVSPNFGWALVVDTAGKLKLYKSADGITETSAVSTVATGVTDGATKWVRATLDVDNGVVGHDVKFYTSDDGSAWTQLGTTVTTALTTTLVDNTAPVQLGSVNNGTGLLLTGNVYSAEIRNGIDGTIVASPDFNTWNPGETSKTDAQGNTWTVNGTATVSRRIASDLDIRVKVALDSWIPSAINTLVAKWLGTGNQRSFMMNVNTTGNLRLQWSVNGVATTTVASSAALSVPDGATKWVRATLDADNGSSQNEVKFYTSDDGVTWTQLGNTQTSAGATSIFDSTALLEIGSRENGVSERLVGHVYYADVRNSIDGPPVAVFDATAVDFQGLSAPTSATGQGTTGRLRLPGTTGNYVSTPDAADISITGDIDLRAKVQLDDWTPATTTTLIAKRTATGNQRSYRLYVNTGGTIGLGLSANGTTEVNVASSVAAGVTDGAVKWIRATWSDVGDVANFYTSDDGSAWTLLGTADRALVSAGIFDSTAVLEIGGYTLGTSDLMTGYVYRAEVYSGIAGTLVAFFDAAGVPVTASRTPTTVAQSGRTWTVNGSAWSWASVANNELWTLNGTAWWWAPSNEVPLTNALRLPGTTGNYVSTPDSAALSITGDIDIRAKVALDDWTPATTQDIIGKAGAAGQRSFYFKVVASGALEFTWTADGTTLLTATSTAATGVTDGATKWVRVTLDVDNGAAGKDIKFYTSDDGSAWTQLGTTVTQATATSIFDSTAAVELGANVELSRYVAGRVYYAEIRNGIAGTVVGVFDSNAVHVTNGATTPTSVPSRTGETYTVSGSGWSWES